jgi:hypothetical protein
MSLEKLQMIATTVSFLPHKVRWLRNWNSGLHTRIMGRHARLLARSPVTPTCKPLDAQYDNPGCWHVLL